MNFYLKKGSHVKARLVNEKWKSFEVTMPLLRLYTNAYALD